MTTTTPEQAAAVRWLTSVAQFGRRTDITKEQAAAICASLAAVTTERDQARQMLADAWDEGVSFGWHSTELRTDDNPYRKAGL